MILDAQVLVYDRDGTTLRGTLAGTDLSWTAGKGGGGLSFTASVLEDDYAPGLFDEAIGQVQVNPGTGWVDSGGPCLLVTSGVVLAEGETGARVVQVVGTTALQMTAEWQVLHDGTLPVNRRGPQVLTFGWPHPAFDDSRDWHDADHVTRASIDSGAARKDQPPHWEVQAADWIRRDALGEGGLTLFRLGSFTVPGTGKVQIRVASCADEEHKVYLYKHGWGGAITIESQQETGYGYSRRWNELLEGGETYFLSAEMTIVQSQGGDGIDALSFYVCPVDDDNTCDPANVLLSSGSSGIRAWRQPKNDPRPGFTVGKILRLLHSANEDWMPAGSSADVVKVGSFSAVLDSDGVEWPDAHERSWSFGTPVSRVLEDLGDVADFEMAAGLHLRAYVSKGSDVSANVALVAGSTARGDDENLTGYTFQTMPRTVTRATYLSDDGYGVLVDDDLEGDYQARSAYLESQQSSSVGEGRRLARRYINENGGTRVVYTASFIGVDGCVPGIDFDWGDRIGALDREGDPSDAQVITWSANRAGDGPVLFSAELQGSGLLTTPDVLESEAVVPADPNYFATPAAVYIPVDTYTSDAVDNAGFDTETDEPAGGERTAWWVYRPVEDGSATFTLDMSPSADASLVIYTGTSLSDLVPFDTAEPTVGPTLTDDVTSGVTYWIQVGQAVAADATYTLTVTGPPTVHAVVTGTTLFGACPGRNTSGSTKTIAEVDAKYGGFVPVIRTFDSSPNALPAGASGHTMVDSWKLPPAEVAAGTHDTAILAYFNTVGEAGQDVYTCMWHEPEDNITAGDFTLSDYRAAYTHLISLLAGASPVANVYLIQTLMAWTWNSASGRDPEDYLVDGVSVLGVDFDGDAPTSPTTYPQFAPAMAGVEATAAAHSMAFGVAEFSSARASGDPDGTLKAAWETDMAGRFVDMGALWVCYFDYPDVGGPTEPNLTAAEINAWTTLVQGS